MTALTSLVKMEVPVWTKLVGIFASVQQTSWEQPANYKVLSVQAPVDVQNSCGSF